MESNKEVMAAIMAAICAYIQEESPSTTVAARKEHLWVISGRRETMRRRTLWQLRMTERARLMQGAEFYLGKEGVIWL